LTIVLADNETGPHFDMDFRNSSNNAQITRDWIEGTARSRRLLCALSYGSDAAE